MNNSKRLVPWQAVAEYIAAGSIIHFEIRDDLATVMLDVAYANLHDENTHEGAFQVLCLNYSYLSLSRLEHHVPGSGAIYEAYLHEQSHLIEDVLAHRLEGKAGALVFQADSLNRALKHLEIVGEITLSVVCEEVHVTTTDQFPPDV
jgi:hypothetical protein